MATQAPPLPPWSWADLEATLDTLAPTMAQQTMLRHFLSDLKDDLPDNPRLILRETICIALAMMDLESRIGIDPHRDPPSLAPS